MAETTKQCRKCKEKKELSTDFFPRNKASKDGFDSMCKACWKLRSQERSKNKGGDAASRVIKRQGLKGYEEAAPSKYLDKVAVVPNDVEIKGLSKYSELPRDKKMMEFSGHVKDAIAEYQKLYKKSPTLIMVPARMFLVLPDEYQPGYEEPDEEQKVTTASKSKKTSKSKSIKRKR